MSSLPSSRTFGSPGFAFRIFTGEDDDAASRSDGLSPSMTLVEFFDQWFLPIVLQGERNARPKTVLLYRDSLRYWVQITGNPPIAKIDEFTLAGFQEGLRQATYKRGKCGQSRPLGKLAIHRHLRNVRTVLFRTGPTTDPNRPSKGLLPAAPHIRITRVRPKMKPCFSLLWAQRIVAAASEIDRPCKFGISPLAWWRNRLSLPFYTGLRSGTIYQLQRKHMVVEDDGRTWLHVPEELVTKTDKESHIVLHPTALTAIEACKRSDDPNELLCPLPHCERHIQTLHDQLQRIAGLHESKWQSPHVWRRVHSDQMVILGLRETTDITKRALDHSDERTTTSHYVDIVNKFRLKLPELWQSSVADPQLTLF